MNVGGARRGASDHHDAVTLDAARAQGALCVADRVFLGREFRIPLGLIGALRELIGRNGNALRQLRVSQDHGPRDTHADDLRADWLVERIDAPPQLLFADVPALLDDPREHFRDAEATTLVQRRSKRDIRPPLPR